MSGSETLISSSSSSLEYRFGDFPRRMSATRIACGDLLELYKSSAPIFPEFHVCSFCRKRDDRSKGGRGLSALMVDDLIRGLRYISFGSHCAEANLHYREKTAGKRFETVTRFVTI